MKVIRKCYDEHARVQVDCSEGGVTQQHFREECDINNIMAKWRKQGVLEHAKNFAGRYGDFASYSDFTTNMNLVVAAQDAFMTLPADIRKRFFNDPAEFYDFATNPENLDEMRNMGLLQSGSTTEDETGALPPEIPAEQIVGTEGDDADTE